MRIALNARILQAPRTGIGQYLIELVSALGADHSLELKFFHGWGWSQQLPQAALPAYNRWVAWAKQVPGAYRLRRALEQHGFDKGLRRTAVDLYHEPSLWPLDFAGPMVMTFHDLTHLHYPQTQPLDRLAEITRQVESALDRARVIITDSQFVADELQQHYGVARDRLKVASLGYAPRFHPRDVSDLHAVTVPLSVTPGSYLLCVGTLEPRKNLVLALRAYALLPEKVRERFPLLIAGMVGWRREDFADELDAALASGHVRLLGYLDDDSLAELLAGARMLLFPSLYEGFGLPVLEAMASGTPVLLSPCAALPEVAGEAGSYIAAEDVGGWRDGILRLIDDQREWRLCREAGLLQASKFSWERCARTTAAAYRQALEY